MTGARAARHEPDPYHAALRTERAGARVLTDREVIGMPAGDRHRRHVDRTRRRATQPDGHVGRRPPHLGPLRPADHAGGGVVRRGGVAEPDLPERRLDVRGLDEVAEPLVGDPDPGDRRPVEADVPDLEVARLILAEPERADRDARTARIHERVPLRMSVVPDREVLPRTVPRAEVEEHLRRAVEAQDADLQHLLLDLVGLVHRDPGVGGGEELVAERPGHRDGEVLLDRPGGRPARRDHREPRHRDQQGGDDDGEGSGATHDHVPLLAKSCMAFRT
jgi:hypothetical protein